MATATNWLTQYGQLSSSGAMPNRVPYSSNYHNRGPNIADDLSYFPRSRTSNTGLHFNQQEQCHQQQQLLLNHRQQQQHPFSFDSAMTQQPLQPYHLETSSRYGQFQNCHGLAAVPLLGRKQRTSILEPSYLGNPLKSPNLHSTSFHFTQSQASPAPNSRINNSDNTKIDDSSTKISCLDSKSWNSAPTLVPSQSSLSSLNTKANESTTSTSPPSITVVVSQPNDKEYLLCANLNNHPPSSTKTSPAPITAVATTATDSHRCSLGYVSPGLSSISSSSSSATLLAPHGSSVDSGFQEQYVINFHNASVTSPKNKGSAEGIDGTEPRYSAVYEYRSPKDGSKSVSPSVVRNNACEVSGQSVADDTFTHLTSPLSFYSTAASTKSSTPWDNGAASFRLFNNATPDMIAILQEPSPPPPATCYKQLPPTPSIVVTCAADGLFDVAKPTTVTTTNNHRRDSRDHLSAAYNGIIDGVAARIALLVCLEDERKQRIQQLALQEEDVLAQSIAMVLDDNHLTTMR